MNINDYSTVQIAEDIAGHLDGASLEDSETFEHYETWREGGLTVTATAAFFTISARDGEGQRRTFQITVTEALA